MESGYEKIWNKESFLALYFEVGSRTLYNSKLKIENNHDYLKIRGGNNFTYRRTFTVYFAEIDWVATFKIW